jgi:8-hydroxy-5-deazaflavin:NADPH oxidoreductase
MTKDPVAIIGGTGPLGFGLALRLGRAGVPVIIGSRDARRGHETAERARRMVPDGSFTGAANGTAIASVSVAFLTVPFRDHADAVASVAEAMRPGQLLVDATVPLAAAVGGKPTRVLGVWQGSAAEQAQELVPEGVAVVSALHTVSAATLSDLANPLDQDVLLCGRRREHKRTVARLLDPIGVRCVDAGSLELSRIIESLTSVMISINGRYRTHAGIRVTGLPAGDLFPPLRAPADASRATVTTACDDDTAERCATAPSIRRQ